MKKISKLTRPEDGSLRAALFLEKPDKKIYPDYYILVPRPTSFKDITNKLKKGLYTSIEDVETEFALMAHNARMYNLDTSPVFAECESLREEFHLKTAQIREQFDLPPPPPYVVDANSVIPVPEVLDEYGVQTAIFTPPGVRPPLPERTRGYIIYNTNGHKTVNSSTNNNLNNNSNNNLNVSRNGVNGLARSQSQSFSNNNNNNNNNHNNGDRDREREINSLSSSIRSNPNQLRNVSSTSNLFQHSSSSSSSSLNKEIHSSLPSSHSSNNLSSLSAIQTTPIDQAIKKKPGSKNKRNSSSERNDSLDLYSPERKKIKKDTDSNNSKGNSAPSGKEEKLYLSLFIPKKKSENDSDSVDVPSVTARSERSQSQNQNQYSDPKIPGTGVDSIKAGSRGSKVKLKGMGRWPV